MSKYIPAELTEDTHLTASAVLIAKEYFNLDFDLTVYWAEAEQYTARGSCVWNVTKQGRKITSKTPSHIQLNKNKDWTLEQIESTLKHEVCHWACFVRKKPYKDGSRFFESELLRIGASSSQRGYGQESIEYQKLVASGQLTRLGDKSFTYEKDLSLDANNHFIVRYKGMRIGTISKHTRGKFKWQNTEPSSKYFGYTYITRKDCAEDMQEEFEKAKKKVMEEMKHAYKHIRAEYEKAHN